MRLYSRSIAQHCTFCALWRGTQTLTRRSILADAIQFHGTAIRIRRVQPLWTDLFEIYSYSAGLHADFLHPVSTKLARNMQNQCGYACTPFSTTWLLLRRFARYSIWSTTFCDNSGTEFREHSTKCLGADSKSRTDGRMWLHIKCWVFNSWRSFDDWQRWTSCTGCATISCTQSPGSLLLCSYRHAISTANFVIFPSISRWAPCANSTAQVALQSISTCQRTLALQASCAVCHLHAQRAVQLTTSVYL